MTSYIKFLQANVRNMIPVVKEYFPLMPLSPDDLLTTTPVVVGEDGSVEGTKLVTLDVAGKKNFIHPTPPQKVRLGVVLGAGSTKLVGNVVITGVNMLGRKQVEVLSIDTTPPPSSLHMGRVGKGKLGASDVLSFLSARAYSILTELNFSGVVTGTGASTTLSLSSTGVYQLAYKIGHNRDVIREDSLVAESSPESLTTIPDVTSGMPEGCTASAGDCLIEVCDNVFLPGQCVRICDPAAKVSEEAMVEGVDESSPTCTCLCLTTPLVNTYIATGDAATDPYVTAISLGQVDPVANTYTPLAYDVAGFVVWYKRR